MEFNNMFGSLFGKEEKKEEQQNQWIKCPKCTSLMYYKEVEAKQNVCPKCNHHFRISADRRIASIVDEGSFKEYDASLAPVDPLKFTDKKSYKKRIEEAKAKTGKTSSVVSGSCTIGGQPAELVVFDFAFMGGSLGSVEGEKIVRAVNRAMEKECGVIIVSASGGARMQESTYSLLQMSKTSAALKRLSNRGLPYISVLTDPTMGGVSASFAMLADIIMAEPGALIGFAGQRVIKQTVGVDLPEGFQRSEFLLEHGLIDMITNRIDMHQTLADLLKLMDKKAS
ncbi:MAG: acetyl-CoA carboxylase, carboxyltransferase subunit beta [Sulfurovum sp.]|nr:acetyl-CoA carboxylase, carboxyltransferase subunit beta [Sulfurovum sp.]MCB4753640.1 acetyl-CoA carboxylase, carboxyltransferase subunit beta [Sulfurovum sp.]MCB4761926.1 acetyl-CoA carboxylase, carboxyltransferase subunit beta [Sulfurovum sp.]MCB4773064.1 acetyl-CoA carboxylase, carboxyltransferase subunit beta [Sulfurovum sp.]MCB4783980.1 acetyl-CoA carboxylase, carboxyltransferase subunit beta [Sulfurovum sp.]